MILQIISTFFVVGLSPLVEGRPQPEQLLPPHTNYLSCGKLYYRTLHLDESRNALYMGAMDRLVKVNLANVSDTSCEYDSMLLEPSNAANCVSKGKSEKYDCRNHIRVIQPIGDGESALCLRIQGSQSKGSSCLCKSNEPWETQVCSRGGQWNF